MKILNALPVCLAGFLILTAFMAAATVDSIQIHSSISGKGPKTILFVHGWTCDETSWKFQVPALSKDYKVITLDLPGHGQSGLPKDGKLTMDMFARAVEAVRAEAKVERVVLAGHSMGTPVVIQYARLFPQHTLALVFVDGSMARSTGTGKPPSVEEFRSREGIIRGMFSPATSSEVQKLILTMMTHPSAEMALAAGAAMQDPAIWKDDVFRQPILGLFAGHPGLTERDLKPRFPNLELHHIPGTGHFLMLEKPEEFNRLLKSFLDKLQY
jgi:pimeloyl-ACP methyl ester carboxylesterase